jgi:hypothetical protein
MFRSTFLLITLLLLLMFQTAHSEETAENPEIGLESSNNDPRQLVAIT